MLTEVIEGLEKFEFTDTRDWIMRNPDDYVEGVMQGFEPTDSSAVTEIDPQSLRELVTEPDVPYRDDASSAAEAHLLDHLHGILKLSDAAVEYYSDGDWRTTVTLSNSERDLIAHLSRIVGCRPQLCYMNALLMAADFGSKYNLTYVEGYALIEGSTSPIAHAWVELDGKVVELTMPNSPQPNPGDVYFGKEYPLSMVQQQILTGVADRLAGQ
ncbi:hypothetical protein [Haloarchaeobius sp. TZWSO28]|uniref:hypothetical protein n=1 Tax=Haloarchaeobius sp. TZWSO28 TaxID=3446119 RepID=UPI003EB77094